MGALDNCRLYKISGHEGFYRFMEQEDGGGPLTTEEDFLNFVPGYAHLTADGRIMRYGSQIGTKHDLIEVIEDDLEERVTRLEGRC